MDNGHLNLSETQIKMESTKLSTLSLLSGLLWIAIGYAIIHFFHDRSVFQIFSDGKAITIQLILGLIAGWVFGEMGRWMFRNYYFNKILDDYFVVKQLKEFSLSNSQIFQISGIAGISEEILFRAAIQPLIGIWLTSFIFIGVHGYIRFKTLSHTIFTLFTLLLSVVLGLLFIHIGILSAITAHTVYDIILLRELKRTK